MIGFIVPVRKVYGDKAMLVCYLFAAFLILPAGLAYWQGDRYVLLAEPLWLVAYSVPVGVLIDRLKLSKAISLGRTTITAGGQANAPV